LDGAHSKTHNNKPACFGIVDIDTTSPAGYRTFAIQHLEDCGYVLTSKVETIHNPVEGIKVFPNPFKSRLTFETKDAALFRRIEILDVTGKKVMEAETKSRSMITFDLSVLPGGIYFTRMYLDNGQIFTGCVIKK